MPTTSNFGWTTPADTDLVKDGALAIRTLGNGIDTSFLDLKGGTTGQILSKASNTDLDYTWINNDQGDITEVQAGTGISVASGTGPIPVVTNTVATAFDAKGDLIGGTGADTFSRLAVGTNGQVLTADSTTATGLKWATASGGGKVLQVVQGYKSDTFSTTSTSFTDVTGLSVSITPSASTSKILIIGQVSIGNIAKDGSTPAATQVRLRRDTTTIFNGDAASTRNQGFSIVEHSDQLVNSPSSFIYLDSPATTSSTTYKVQILTNNASATTYVNRSFNDSDSPLVLRTASSIIALEIGA